MKLSMLALNDSENMHVFHHKEDKTVKRMYRALLTLLMLCVLVEQIVLITPMAQNKVDFLPRLREEQLASIEAITKKAIRTGKIPGAVILIGNQEKVIYRRAFGHRALAPHKLPMTIDTIFDIASLTKVIATTTAVMQLVEKGNLGLEERRVQILAGV